MRFNNAAEVKQWAATAAAEDHLRHQEHGIDFNPYSTVGRRHDWERGYNRSPPHSYETTLDFDTAYQRGLAYGSLIMSQLKEVLCRHVDCPALGAVAVLAQQNSFGYALVGGAVRDAYHSHVATDHDIAVWGLEPSLFNDLDHALSEVGYICDKVHVDDPEYNADAADGRYVLIAEYSHVRYPAVDILVFSSEFSSLSDVLNSFDYNLNQFAITLDDVAKSERQTAYFGGDQLYVLRKLSSSNVTEERHARMLDKANHYGWKVPQEEVCSQLPLPQ